MSRSIGGSTLSGKSGLSSSVKKATSFKIQGSATSASPPREVLGGKFVSVSSGCPIKIPPTGWLYQQTFISHNFGDWEFEIEVEVNLRLRLILSLSLRLRWVLFFWLSGDQHLAVCKHDLFSVCVQRERGLFSYFYEVSSSIDSTFMT